MFLLLSLSFHDRAGWDEVWNVPLVGLGQLSWLWLLSGPCPPPGSSQRTPVLCSAQQQLKPCCVTSSDPGTNTNTWKVSSILAWPLCWGDSWWCLRSYKGKILAILKRTLLKHPSRPGARNSCTTYNWGADVLLCLPTLNEMQHQKFSQGTLGVWIGPCEL